MGAKKAKKCKYSRHYSIKLSAVCTSAQCPNFGHNCEVFRTLKYVTETTLELWHIFPCLSSHSCEGEGDIWNGGWWDRNGWSNAVESYRTTRSPTEGKNSYNISCHATYGSPPSTWETLWQAFKILNRAKTCNISYISYFPSSGARPFFKFSLPQNIIWKQSVYLWEITSLRN